MWDFPMSARRQGGFQLERKEGHGQALARALRMPDQPLPQRECCCFVASGFTRPFPRGKMPLRAKNVR